MVLMALFSAVIEKVSASVSKFPPFLTMLSFQTSTSWWPSLNSKTLLSIIADLNNSVIFTVSILSLIINSARLFSRQFRITPKTSTVIGVTVTFMIHCLFISLVNSRYCYFYLPIRVFRISVSWWFFTGDWVPASLLKSPGLFSVFWPFSIGLGSTPPGLGKRTGGIRNQRKNRDHPDYDIIKIGLNI